MAKIEQLLEQFQNEQAAQIAHFKTVIDAMKFQEKKIEQLTKERDAAIADIESIMQNVNNNIVCRWCKYYSSANECKYLQGEDCKPKWRGMNDR